MNVIRFCIIGCLISFLCGCSSQKFLNENENILSSVKLVSDDPNVSASNYRVQVRQEPNAKWFNLFKVPLGLYCISGTDTTKSSNQFWRRIGQAPVIYNETQTTNSRNALALALKDKGYLQASATTDVYTDTVKRRVKVKYTLHPGKEYIIRNINYQIDDPQIESHILNSKDESYLQPGMRCDASLLDKERSRITTLLHNKGYYHVLKKFVTYNVDTLAGPNDVSLTLLYKGKSISSTPDDIYNIYRIGKVRMYMLNQSDDIKDSIILDNKVGVFISYLNTNKKNIHPSTLLNSLALHPGKIYREQDITQTYSNLYNLQAISYTSIQTKEAGPNTLDCDIRLVPAKINTFGVQLEGTNTSGNLGIASSLTYTNRNLFNGSEEWSTKLKGAYEAITGLEGYSDQNYVEIGLETKLTFPKLIIPFARNHHRGTTNISIQFDTQERPEFHRRVLSALWSYQWKSDKSNIRYRFDIPSLNYVYMPWISDTFRKEYLESETYRSALIRYAYENLLILNTTFSRTYSSASSSSNGNKINHNPYQIHWSIESSGNLLYLLAKTTSMHKDANDQFTLFNVAFAQYLKFDFDFSKSYYINPSNSFALHTAFGIAQPYGNSTIVPFEKRYFGGGANGIRGWSVRELGPGRYMGEDGKVDFINQTGNLKLLFSAEYRTHLFWKINGALFVDAGNIWNTRNYEATGSKGQFKFKSFWKEIAASYGIGFRFNLDYFILRIDMAMKAINPAYETNQKKYLPILHPIFSRDFTFHFAVGLPF